MEELEKRGVISPSGEGYYNFSHDFVRHAVYRRISPPRKRLLHLHIANTLAGFVEKDYSFASDLTYHCAMGGDYQLMVKACAKASSHSLQLFATNETIAFASRGLKYIETLEKEEQLSIKMELLNNKTLAISNAGFDYTPEIEGELTKAVAEAKIVDNPSEVARGYYLLSVLHQDKGDIQEAQNDTLYAAEAGRAGNAETKTRQLANSGRCLMQLERNVIRSRSLIYEAQELAAQKGIEDIEVFWGLGLLHRWDGKYSEAASSMDSAFKLAQFKKDSWRESNCLIWMATIALEIVNFSEVHNYCDRLSTINKKMDNGGKDHYVEALSVIAKYMTEGLTMDRALEKVIGSIRQADNLSLLSYILNHAAVTDFTADRVEQAQKRSVEALAAADAVRRTSEIAIASSTLALIESAQECATKTGAYMKSLLTILSKPDAISARAREAVCNSSKALGINTQINSNKDM